jgi:hypothetical protein
MAGGLGPRFALEAAFLILLATAAAYARLDAAEIILVMAAGWLVASIFEVLAARRERLYPGAVWERRIEAEEAPAERDEQPERGGRFSWSRRPADVAVPREEVAAVETEAPPSRAQPAAEQSDEATGEIELPSRRRWFRRTRARPEVAADVVASRPSARHVRLIRGSPPQEDAGEERQDAEAGS